MLNDYIEKIEKISKKTKDKVIEKQLETILVLFYLTNVLSDKNTRATGHVERAYKSELALAQKEIDQMNIEELSQVSLAVSGALLSAHT